MLNEQSITQFLTDTVEHLQAGNLEQAEAHLDILDFDRMLHPIRYESKGGPIQFIDPAEPFGVERVHETGRHIRACREAIQAGQVPAALIEAQAAFDRWSKR